MPNTAFKIGSVRAQSRVWLSDGAGAASEGRIMAGQRQLAYFTELFTSL